MPFLFVYKVAKMTAALKLVSLGGGDFGGRQQGIRRKASKRSAGDGPTSEPPGELESKPNQPPAGRGYGSGGDVSWKEIGPYAASFGMGVRGRRFYFGDLVFEGCTDRTCTLQFNVYMSTVWSSVPLAAGATSAARCGYR